jgi:hypothetical protein
MDDLKMKIKEGSEKRVNQKCAIEGRRGMVGKARRETREGRKRLLGSRA